MKVEYVEGIVTLDGELVLGANVVFVPLTKGEGTIEAAGGMSDGQGRYKLSSMNGDPEKGAVAGKYRVLIEKVEVRDLTVNGSQRRIGDLDYIQISLLPKIYGDKEKSPLTATVNPGKNNIDLELKKQP
ncbi:hypothetical protein FACS189443_7220 [Planctomycetales bacterium]|nr:hypothetical protein FACS189443_7220 [Planctomycetales bacterium]